MNDTLEIIESHGTGATPAPLTWSEAFAAGPEICGGKGYNLGRLKRYGFRVPRGGVIPANWYTELLSLIPAGPLAFLQSVGADGVLAPAVLAALDQTRSALETAKLPPALEAALETFLLQQGLARVKVAVRSSATAEDGARASFAGIHRSFLNVRGVDTVARAILGCYASLWTPQALAYRRRMAFRDDEVLCAVVICEMVHAPGADEPHSAGVAFSFDPLSGRRDLIVIDAALGLGEAVVSGSVNPQRIVFRNLKGRLLFESRNGGPEMLPPDRQRELAHQVFRLHWAFSDGQDPQDVEWAYDGKKIWILQVRPATNVRRFVPAAVSSLPRYWSTANIKDAVPGVVSTLAWSYLKDTVDAVAFAGPIVTGYPIDAGAELTRRFRGRAYFELTLMQWIMYDALGVTPRQVVQSIGGHQPEIPVPGDPMKGPEGRRRALASLRLLRRVWRVERELKEVFAKWDQRMRRIQETDLTQLTMGNLLSVYGQFALANDAMDIAIGVANSAEGPWEIALESLLKPVFGDQARSMMSRLLAGTGSVTSAEHGYAIFQLAAAARSDQAARLWLESRAPSTEWTKLPQASAFRKELEAFLRKFGHRAVYEADCMNPRWADDPAYILDQVRCLLAGPQTEPPRDAAQHIREQAEALVRRQAGWRAPIAFWLARKLGRAMAARESAKSEMAMIIHRCRRLGLEFGRRLVAAGHLDNVHQIFHLAAADILCWMEGWWDGSGAQELTADRVRQREAWLAEEAPPDVITEEPDGRVSAAPLVSSGGGDAWSGIGVAPGRARGIARIIRHPNQGHTLQPGEVLVAPSTDPGWTPLFLRASAIVMESGGYLSHGAIVAREYGIPAVVNLPGILTDLQDGDVLVVDGDSGRLVREP